MERKEFKIQINAPREKVWKVLWEDETYRAWTSVFSPNSWAKTDWKKGSKVLFLDGNNTGMVSTIVDVIPNEFMSIKHLGNYKNGVEDLESEEVKRWTGAFENYTLKPVNGKTELIVHMDMNVLEEFNFLLEIWPKALEKVKSLAENNR